MPCAAGRAGKTYHLLKGAAAEPIKIMGFADTNDNLRLDIEGRE
jgi:hypothetical protein